MSLLTFIVLVFVGAQFRHHPGDPTGAKTGVVSDYQTQVGNDATKKDVEVSQVGINQLAGQTGHVGVSVNFTWTLLTGFLVLFMQVGFALLVTGLTRAKNAAHMIMMNLTSFAFALLAYS